MKKVLCGLLLLPMVSQASDYSLVMKYGTELAIEACKNTSPDTRIGLNIGITWFGTIAGIQLLHFVDSSSLYIRPTIGYYTCEGCHKSPVKEFDIKGIAAGMSLGNEWKYNSGFILGGDWIGSYLIVSKYGLSLRTSFPSLRIGYNF